MTESKHPTPKDVAQFMMGALKLENELYQNDIVYRIAEEFGEPFTYENENGNLAIDKKVLGAFREISNDLVIWERGPRMWRKREDYDEPGRQQG